MAGTTTHPGPRVRSARLARGWSQERLAEVLGTTQTRVSALERGRYQDMASSTLADLSRALGVSTDWLLGLSEEGGPE